MTRKQWQGIWVTELCADDGARALVADHGAQVLSWVPADGAEALFLSTRSRYGAGSAMRGGVPVIFPQFAERGNGQRHGFARVREWRVEQAGQTNVRLQLQGDGSDAAWPHAYALSFEVQLEAQALQMTLTVCNTSDHAWTFCAALHTYCRVADIETVELHGLHGRNYADQVQGGVEATELDESLRVTAEIDRLYAGAGGDLLLRDGRRTLVLKQQGFGDTVVWNPGPQKAAQLADLLPDEYRAFLCVEAGAIEVPVTLQAGQRWQGTQVLSLDARQNAT